jgi:hypothetical protein
LTFRYHRINLSKMSKEAPQTYVNITLNRASFGGDPGDDVFAIIEGEGGCIVGHVPGDDISIDRQEVSSHLSAKLKVKIVEEGEKWDAAEVQINPGEVRRLRIDKKTHKVLPIKMKAVYYEGQ